MFGDETGEALRHLYDPVSKCHLIHCVLDTGDSSNGLRSVLARYRNEHKYRRLGPNTSTRSWEEIIPSRGKLVILVLRINDDGSAKANIDVLDLKTRRGKALSSQANPTALVGVSTDGKWIFVKHLERQISASGESRGEYFLARVTIDGRRFEKLGAWDPPSLMRSRVRRNGQ